MQPGLKFNEPYPGWQAEEVAGSPNGAFGTTTGESANSVVDAASNLLITLHNGENKPWAKQVPHMYNYPPPQMMVDSLGMTDKSSATESFHHAQPPAPGRHRPLPPPVPIHEMHSARLGAPRNDYNPGLAPNYFNPPQDTYMLSRSISYSHNLPDVVPDIIYDNDYQRRMGLNSEDLEMCLKGWTNAPHCRLVQFSVDEIPTYYATWAAKDKLDWIVWTVPRITGIAMLSEKLVNTPIPQSGTSSGLQISQSAPVSHNCVNSRSILQMLFRTERVQIMPLENTQHARSLLQFLREEVDPSNHGRRAMYLYLNSLPAAIEASLNTNVPFMNAATLSLYQKILSSSKSVFPNEHISP